MTKREKLLDASNRLGPSALVFAMLDGARFEILPELLRAAGLPERPLYRERRGPTIRKGSHHVPAQGSYDC